MKPIQAPFFEIGPKNYLYGDDVLALALAADEAAKRYRVDVVFTCPLLELRPVAASVTALRVFAPHMDALLPGRGLADTLPEAVKAAGGQGVMLNHCEHPLSLSTLCATLKRARELELQTIVCADSLAEIRAVAELAPDIIVAEPAELIGTGVTSAADYVNASICAVKERHPEILVLQGAGIHSGEDVYRVIFAGAEGTGSSSGIACAGDRAGMVDEMVGAVRQAWDDRCAARG